jgi:hypothetical protein
MAVLSQNPGAKRGRFSCLLQSMLDLMPEIRQWLFPVLSYSKK